MVRSISWVEFWFNENRCLSFAWSNWVKTFKVMLINDFLKKRLLSGIVLFLFVTFFKIMKLRLLNRHTFFFDFESQGIIKINFLDYIIFLDILSELLDSFGLSITRSMRSRWININPSNWLERIIRLNSIWANYWLFVRICHCLIQPIL